MKRWRWWLAIATLALLALDRGVAGLAERAPTGTRRPDWQVGDWWLLHGRQRGRFVRMSDPPWVESPVYRLEVTAQRPCAAVQCYVVELRAFGDAAAARRGNRSERPLAELWYRQPTLELVHAETRLRDREPLRWPAAPHYLPFPVFIPDFGRQQGVSSAWTDPSGHRHAAVSIPFATGAQAWSGGAPWWVAWSDGDRELNMIDASWWRDGRRRPDFLAAAARQAESAAPGPSGQLPLAQERAGMRPGAWRGMGPGTWTGGLSSPTPAPQPERRPSPAPTARVPLLLVDQAHDNFFRLGAPEDGTGTNGAIRPTAVAGYRRFAEIARADGWRVAAQPAPWTATALDNARLVVVPLPQRPYSDAEIQALRRFVEAGGGLLLALEGGPAGAVWTDPSRSLADAFGFVLASEPARDGQEGVLGREAIATRPAAGHPIGQSVDRAHAFRAYPVRGGQSLLITLAKAEPSGAAVLAASGFGRGRVAVAGDANLFDDAFGLAGPAGNHALVSNLLDWLSDRPPVELRYAIRGPVVAGGRVPVTLAAGRLRADHRGTRVIRLRSDAGGRFAALLYVSIVDTHPPRLRIDKLVVDVPEYAVWPVGEERTIGDGPMRIPFAVEDGRRPMEVDVELLPPPAPAEEHP